MRKKDIEMTKKYLRYVYQNDNQNTIVETYIDSKNDDIVNKKNKKTTFNEDDIFALFVLRDNDFIQEVFKANKKEIKEMSKNE